MKRIFLFFSITLICAGIGRSAYHAATPQVMLSTRMPAGAVLYLEAKDFSSLLNEWNSSLEKRVWVQSDNYEMFSRSHLFLRLKGAGDQFAAATGLPPDMDFLSQVAGQSSALAVYDIGKLQFLYITYLPSARSMQTTLWQRRTKFETRSIDGVDFFVRSDPESQRQVSFAVTGDYLLLATREDLIAGALRLFSGKGSRALDSESWWTQSTASAGQAGDLRMVLDLKTLVPTGYFRTYWVQQNITDLSQYSSAVSDLFREGKQYREERVLIRKTEWEAGPPSAGVEAVADLSRLVPDDAGVFTATANPSAESCFSLIEGKLLAPHLGPAPASQLAPQVQLTTGEQGNGSDLETRIDQAPAATPAGPQDGLALKGVLGKSPILGSLVVQSSQQDSAGVFIRTHSVVAMESSTEWNESEVETAIADFVAPGLTAGQLGFGWSRRVGSQQLDGLWPLSLSVRGKYLVLSDDPRLMESILENFSRKPDRKPALMLAGLNHAHERANFTRFTNMVDRPNSAGGSGNERQPQFFSGNMASLSSTLGAITSEHIEVQGEAGRIRQKVTYEWSQ